MVSRILFDKLNELGKLTRPIKDHLPFGGSSFPESKGPLKKRWRIAQALIIDEIDVQYGIHR